MKPMLISTTVALALSGCTQTLWVHEKPTNSKMAASAVEGLPFYIKTKKYDQETKWEKIWYEAILKITKKPVTTNSEAKQTAVTQSFTKEFTKEQLSQLTDLKKEILSLKDGDQQDGNHLILQFMAMQGMGSSNDVKEVLVANKISSKWVVDSSRLFYLNSPLPWFGSNNINQKLNDDGTLNQASSAPNTKLSEGISSLIPFKEYLTSRYVTPLDTKYTKIQGGESNQGPSFSYVVSINIQQSGYIYIFSKQCDTRENCTKPIPFDTNGGVFTRTRIMGNNANDKNDKTDVKSISYQGKITLKKDDGKSN